MRSFIKKSKKLQEVLLGINQRNVELIYPHNNIKNYKLADDKVLTKTVLEKHGLACAETYIVIEEISYIESAWESLTQYQKIAVKPANGRGGGGIMILKKDQNGKDWLSGGKAIAKAQVIKHLADIITGVYSLGSRDKVLVEYCIEPHPFFYEIFPSGVPDFRVILLKNTPVLSMLRVPTERSDGKANLHQGGLGIGIDMENGTLKMAYDGHRYYENHPDTNSQIKGRLIPYWEETMALAIQTSKVFPLDYLGIDIVIDKKLGPLIMEINVRPGLSIQLVNQEGMQKVLHEHPSLKGVLSSSMEVHF